MEDEPFDLDLNTDGDKMNVQADKMLVDDDSSAGETPPPTPPDSSSPSLSPMTVEKENEGQILFADLVTRCLEKPVDKPEKKKRGRPRGQGKGEGKQPAQRTQSEKPAGAFLLWTLHSACR